MTRFDFTIYFDLTEITDEAADRLFEAGCDDASIGSRQGVSHAVFHREAKTLEEAIQSAAEDIRSAGFRITQIETEESAKIQALNSHLAS